MKTLTMRCLMRHVNLCPHRCSGNFPSIFRCHSLGKNLFLLCLTVADRIYFYFFRHSCGQLLACGLHSQPRRIRHVQSEASAGAALPHCPRMRMPRGPRMGDSLASPHRPRMSHRLPAITSARPLGISLPSCGRHPLPPTDRYAGTR